MAADDLRRFFTRAKLTDGVLDSIFDARSKIRANGQTFPEYLDSLDDVTAITTKQITKWADEAEGINSAQRKALRSQKIRDELLELKGLRAEVKAAKKAQQAAVRLDATTDAVSNYLKDKYNPDDIGAFPKDWRNKGFP